MFNKLHNKLFISMGLCVCVSTLVLAQEAPIIRPGEEVSFRVETKKSKLSESKSFGKIAGKSAFIVDTSCDSCEMGKRMIIDDEDNIWFLMTREDKVVKIDPSTNEMEDYKLPLGSGPYSLGIDSKGILWMSAHGIEMLLELNPKTKEIISHAPPSHGFLVHVNVEKKTDTVYFAQPGANLVVSFRRKDGFKEFRIPTPQSGPARIDFDSKGNVWFPELYTNKIARLTPMSGEFKEWDLPTEKGFPAFLRVDENDVVWVSQPMADKIVRFEDGKFKEFTVPTKNSIVSTQDVDKDGFIWFTQGGWRGSAGGNKVGRLNPRTGEIDELEIPILNAQPAGIVVTKSGDIWFQLTAKGKVVRLTSIKADQTTKNDSLTQ